jgi:hypothetical protein
MDAVCDATDHPQLHEHAIAGEYDIAAATRALRADLARMTTLADAAATIDATLAAADVRARPGPADLSRYRTRRSWQPVSLIISADGM